MVNDTKRFFTLALSVIVIITLFTLLITPVVFVSGCVGGATCTANDLSNCTSGQACFKGTCTANCTKDSDCTAANTVCRLPTNDESGSTTSKDAKFCLSKISETTSTSTTTSTTSTTQTSSSNYDNPPQRGISNNLLDATAYVKEPSKVKLASEVEINIEVKNKGSENGEDTNIVKDYFNNVVKLGEVNFNNINAKIEHICSGCELSSSNTNSLTVLDGKSTNTSFKLKAPASLKVGDPFTFTYKIMTNASNPNSYLSFSDVQLGGENNFEISLKNESDKYKILISDSIDFKILSLKFTPTTSGEDNTYCTAAYCTKEYNVTLALKDEKFVLKDITAPVNRGGATDVSIISSKNKVDELNKTNKDITFSINITLNNIQGISLQNSEKKQYTITLSSTIGEVRLFNYESDEGTAKIYINSCDKDSDCKDNKVCKDKMCVVKGSSTSSSSGQV